MLIGGTSLEEFLILIDQVAAAAVVLVISLSWRRYWLAVPACFAATYAIIFASVAALDPLEIFDTDLVIIAYYATPALMTLLVAIGVLRGFGYRLSA
jgi:hypothetical protein